MWTFAHGGNAVDAALAANAAIAVVAPHLCGLGGDLFAIVRTPSGEVHGLDASGSAGSGSDAGAMRAEGLRRMPLRHDVRSVDRARVRRRLDAAARAIRLAAVRRDRGAGDPPRRGRVPGQPAARARRSPCSTTTPRRASSSSSSRRRTRARSCAGPVWRSPCRRSSVAVARRSTAERSVRACSSSATGCSTPPTSIACRPTGCRCSPSRCSDTSCTRSGRRRRATSCSAIAGLVQRVGLPGSPDDVEWAHLFVEAVKAASFDRPDVLHDDADGADLLARAVRRAGTIDPDRAARRCRPASDAGDTTYLCTADDRGLGRQPDPVERLGLRVVAGRADDRDQPPQPWARVQPAARTPGRADARSPAAAHAVPGAGDPRRGGAGRVRADGGDAQPPILLQLAARLLFAGATPADAIAAPRVVLRGAATGFDTWDGEVQPTVVIEDHAPAALAGDPARAGPRRREAPAFDPGSATPTPSSSSRRAVRGRRRPAHRRRHRRRAQRTLSRRRAWWRGAGAQHPLAPHRERQAGCRDHQSGAGNSRTVSATAVPSAIAARNTSDSVRRAAAVTAVQGEAEEHDRRDEEDADAQLVAGLVAAHRPAQAEAERAADDGGRQQERHPATRRAAGTLVTTPRSACRRCPSTCCPGSATPRRRRRRPPTWRGTTRCG